MLYKLYASIVADRLRGWAEGILRETQYGFRRNRSTEDPIHLVRRAQDLIEEREYQTLHMVFLDWEKAFDSINRKTMIGDFQSRGLGDVTCGVLRALLESPVFRVRMNQDISDWKPQERGVRQGCTLPPLLFIIQLSIVMDRVQGQLLHEIPLALTPVFSFPEVSFADDTIIISKVSWVATRALQLLQLEAAK
eukprot:3509902-Alexandrium_andersonii.AAC.1